MHTTNNWGGTFEIEVEPTTEDEYSQNMEMDQARLLRQQLDETQQGWLLGPRDIKKESYIDLGCIIVKRKVLKWAMWSLLVGLIVIGVPVITVKFLPRHKELVSPPDKYTVALRKALLFFNAQKSGQLPENNGIPWRGDSAMQDGSLEVKGGLVGGYYDAGDNIKFHFPMAFSMTLLSWSVIEYGYKYKEIGEYNHITDIIKWGTDYLLKTFNSSASTITHIYSQVGMARKGSTSQDDEHYCWQRPEDMNYHRPVQTSTSAPDLGSEMAAALAAASIVFRDETAYSKKLIKAAKTVYKFATDPGQRSTYSLGNDVIAPFYNSTGFWDEYIWAAAWMYYATGNYTYILAATDVMHPENAKAFLKIPDLRVFSWDNKLPGANLLLTRLRIFLNPGYPYEDMLSRYHSTLDLNMCSFLRQFHVFNWTKGGLIQLNHGRPLPLQYAANAAFIASLYADYMNASNIPGWKCGPKFISSSSLRRFAASQVNYILGANPKNMSYVVGYAQNYPRYVHHRGASIPYGHPNHQKYSCTAGWKWRDAKSPNPNVITGAMVGGPNPVDGFPNLRRNPNYSEPTLAGNAGLVAALIALMGSGGGGIDKNTIFSAVQPLYSPPSPHASPWKP